MSTGRRIQFSCTSSVREPARASKTRRFRLDTVYLFQQDGKHLLDVDFLERVIAREHAFKRPNGKRTGRELACEHQGKKRQDGTSGAMREPPSIPEEHLRACLQQQYDLIPITLDFLPLGLDYNAGVYRVVSEQGTPYLLKVKSRSLYEPSCLVPRYLSDQGITSVVAPFPTKSNALWTQLEDWTVIVYPFLDGNTS